MRPTDQESTAIEKMVVIHSFHEEGRCHAPCTIWGEQEESVDVNLYCGFLRDGMGKAR